MKPLSELKPGERAKIHAIEADSLFQHRLIAMGFKYGKVVEVIRVAKFNGPIQVRLGSTDIIIRQQDARQILLSQA